MIWVDWIAIISTILLIIAVLLQSSDDNIQDAFSGEKSELFKNKKILSILMVVSVILSNNLR
jgi:preprotein translocase subunit SecG